MPEVIANLPDGTQLHFPDGTDPSIVQGIVRKKLGTQTSSFDPGSRGVPSSFHDLSESNQPAAQTSVSPATIGQSFDAPAAFAIGRTAASMTPNPELAPFVGAGVGLGSYLGLDFLLQKLSGKEPDLTDSAVNLGVNELGGRAIGKVMQGAKGLLPKSLQSLSELSPTFSQYLDRSEPTTLSGKIAKEFTPVAKVTEDIFSPGSKADAIKNSGKLADTAVTDTGIKLSGRSPNVLANPQAHAATIQTNNLQNALDSTFVEADKQATTAKLVAGANPQTIIVKPGVTTNVPTTEIQQLSKSLGNTTFENLQPFEQQQVLSLAQKMNLKPFNQLTTQPVTSTVNGPINLKSTLENAYKIVQEAKGLELGPTEEQKPLVNQAAKLIGGTNAQFDPTGKLVSANPLGFTEAWDQKQALDNYGGWNKSKNDITHTDNQFRGLTRNLNQDIEDSIPNWQNDPNKIATQAWKNAKATVEQRNTLFFPEGSSNKLGDIIQETDSPLPAISKIVKDPVVLQRALNSGNIKFPSGKIESNNMRGDLGAFALKDLFENSKTIDPKNPQGGLTVDPQSLQSKWNDPAFLESKKLLFNSQQRSDIDQLFKNIAYTQTKQNAFGLYLSKAYLMRSGLALAPALFTGYLTGSAEHAMGVAGVELGAMGMAKLMTNSKTARFLVSAAAGQPLNASEQTIARSIVSGLQGVTIMLRGNDGSEQKGSFDKDGKFIQEGDNK